MSLSKIREAFVKNLTPVYQPEEAEQIFILIVENLTGINLRINKSATFTPDGCFIKMFADIEKRLLQHEPIQYILNEAWFYDIPFYVDKNVLIPRPETEELVHWIVKDYTDRTPTRILDIGSGSGCIPIILKRKFPEAAVFSCDLSAQALKVAEKNARKHQTAISWIELDFLKPDNWNQLPKCDILVSNPPYIPEEDLTDMQRNVSDHEPHLALFVANSNPLIFYEAIAKASKSLLVPRGAVYVEIHEKFGASAVQLFEEHQLKPILKQDMQGKDRMIKCTF
ncbi:peptide chain release factor N(5)-glutamine methyltransferase [Niabella insulamsoli]|uniref:peptide chain release factor N(5)-glutamine methyltransferase n=1 Tax=Niabella insulamsoli TaxID=3144874 RepID=UPI0031FD90EA